MNDVTIVKEQDRALNLGSKSNSFSTVVRQVHWETSDGRHFVGSEANVTFTGQEILVFPADEYGEIADFGEVAGGRDVSWDWAKDDLIRYLNDDDE